MMRQAENFAAGSDLLNKSPAFRQALDDWARAGLGTRNSDGSVGSESSKLANWLPKDFIPTGFWSRDSWPDLRGLPVPSWRSLSIPDLHLGGPLDAGFLGAATRCSRGPEPIWASDYW